MQRKIIQSIILVLSLSLGFSCTKKQDTPYEPNWESLSKHQEEPEWFADAKLGIYFHWGVYSVPAYKSAWYPYYMYRDDGNEIAKYHRENYGDPADFNYHDFVPMFKAENFDAKEWVALFKKAGARFSGPVAQHHDGFAMWASDVNPWNVRDKGPMQDITGELAKELRANDMKLITTFHHARNLQRYKTDTADWGGFHSHFTYNPKYATSSTDPVIRKMYGNIPEEEFHQYWLDQLKEVIDKYNPEIIWFDSWLNCIPEETKQEFAAYYFNEAKRKGQEVIIAYKQSDIPAEVGVKDIEQGGKKELSSSVWMTDVTISNGTWSYTQDQTYKSADLVLRNMIDVWSKNGVVLLNVSPMADGTIPEEQKSILLDIGAWMDKYGEAIYNTRPFEIYGVGTAKAQEGRFGGQSATIEYTAEDVRFTRSKDYKTIYIIFLGKPEQGEKIDLETFRLEDYSTPSPIKRITVLGTSEEVQWEDAGNHFYFTIPDDMPLDEMATVLKMELE